MVKWATPAEESAQQRVDEAQRKLAEARKRAEESRRIIIGKHPKATIDVDLEGVPKVPGGAVPEVTVPDLPPLPPELRALTPLYGALGLTEAVPGGGEAVERKYMDAAYDILPPISWHCIRLTEGNNP